MHMIEAMQDFPAARRGYLLSGNPGAVGILLKTYFPQRTTATSERDLSLAGTGVTVVPPELAEACIEYVKLPKSDMTYVIVLTDDDATLKSALIKQLSSRILTRIDCSDPTSPKVQNLMVGYIKDTLRLPELTARALMKRARWDLPKILRTVYTWNVIVGKSPISDKQAHNLLQTLLPTTLEEDVAEALLTKKFHLPVNLPQCNAEKVLLFVSQELDKVRIVHSVPAGVGHSELAQKTGMTPSELERYTMLAKNLRAREIPKWNAALTWCWNRRALPGALGAFVGLVRTVQ